MASISKEADFPKSSCFFCSKQIEKKVYRDLRSGTKSVSVVAKNVFSLRYVARFLKLFEDYGDDPSPLKHKLHALANVSVVPVCENCKKLTKEFTTHYKVLERERVKVEWCVQKMHDVMTMAKANEEGDQSEPLEPEPEEEKDDPETLLMVTLKTKMIDKMKLFSLQHPRVRLLKAKIPSSSSPSIETQLEDIQPSNLTDAVGFEPSTTNLEMRPEQDNLDFLHCSYCRARFNKNRSWMLRQHTLGYHCEHFFPNERLDTVTDAQYKKIVSEFLFKDLIAERDCCSFCEQKFPGRNKGLKMKSHLVESHHKELKEKLRDIQMDHNLADTLNRYNPQGRICKCGTYLRDLKSQTTHDKSHCKLVENEDQQQQPLRSPAQDNILEIGTRGSGESQVEIPLAFTVEKAHSANEQEQQIIWSPAQDEPQEIDASQSGESDPAAAAALSSSTEEKVHNGNETSLQECTKNPGIAKLKRKKSRIPVEGLPIEKKACNYCRAEFRCTSLDFKLLLTNHFVRFHPEHFFPDAMDTTATATVTKDQFQRIIHNILFPAFLPKEESLACSLCQIKFDYYDTTKVRVDCCLKKHLVEHHRRKLAAKLRQILKDPNLMQMLSDFDAKGMSCPCGMYLPEWGTIEKNNHEMFHCKLTTFGSDKDEFLIDSLEDSEVNQIVPYVKKATATKRNLASSSNELVIRRKKPRNSDSLQKKHLLPSSSLTKSENDVEYLSCSHCRAKFGSATSSKYGLRHHMLQYHLETIFPNSRLNSVTRKEFQKILAELLFKELVHEEMTSCRYCVITFATTKCKIRTIKLHLIRCHCDKLEERLEQIQKDPSLEEILSKCNPNGKCCTFCGLYLTDKGRLKIHERLHCTGTMADLTSEPKPEVGESIEIQNLFQIDRQRLPPPIVVEGRLEQPKLNESEPVNGESIQVISRYAENLPREMENRVEFSKADKSVLEVGASGETEGISANTDGNLECLPTEIENRLQDSKTIETEGELRESGESIKDISRYEDKVAENLPTKIGNRLKDSNKDESELEVDASFEKEDIFGNCNGVSEVLPMEIEDGMVHSKDNRAKPNMGESGESREENSGDVDSDCGDLPVELEEGVRQSNAKSASQESNDIPGHITGEFEDLRMETGERFEHLKANEPDPEASAHDDNSQHVSRHVDKECVNLLMDVIDRLEQAESNESKMEALDGGKSCQNISVYKDQDSAGLPITTEDRLLPLNCNESDMEVDTSGKDISCYFDTVCEGHSLEVEYILEHPTTNEPELCGDGNVDTDSINLPMEVEDRLERSEDNRAEPKMGESREDIFRKDDSDCGDLLIETEDRVEHSKANELEPEANAEEGNCENVSGFVDKDCQGILMAVIDRLEHSEANESNLELHECNKDISGCVDKEGVGLPINQRPKTMEPKTDTGARVQSKDVSADAYADSISTEDILEHSNDNEPGQDNSESVQSRANISLCFDKDGKILHGVIEDRLECSVANDEEQKMSESNESQGDISRHCEREDEGLTMEVEGMLEHSKAKESEQGECAGGESREKLFGQIDNDYEGLEIDVKDRLQKSTGNSGLGVGESCESSKDISSNIDKDPISIPIEVYDVILESSKANETEPNVDAIGESSKDVSLYKDKDFQGVPMETEDTLDLSKSDEPERQASESCGQISDSIDTTCEPDDAIGESSKVVSGYNNKDCQGLSMEMEENLNISKGKEPKRQANEKCEKISDSIDTNCKDMEVVLKTPKASEQKTPVGEVLMNKDCNALIMDREENTAGLSQENQEVSTRGKSSEASKSTESEPESSASDDDISSHLHKSNKVFQADMKHRQESSIANKPEEDAGSESEDESSSDDDSDSESLPMYNEDRLERSNANEDEEKMHESEENGDNVSSYVNRHCAGLPGDVDDKGENSEAYESESETGTSSESSEDNSDYTDMDCGDLPIKDRMNHSSAGEPELEVDESGESRDVDTDFEGLPMELSDANDEEQEVVRSSESGEHISPVTNMHSRDLSIELEHRLESLNTEQTEPEVSKRIEESDEILGGIDTNRERVSKEMVNKLEPSNACELETSVGVSGESCLEIIVFDTNGEAVPMQLQNNPAEFREENVETDSDVVVEEEFEFSPEKAIKTEPPEVISEDILNDNDMILNDDGECD